MSEEHSEELILILGRIFDSISKLLPIAESTVNNGRSCKGKYYDEGGYSLFNKGIFHHWGTSYEEFESGPASYTVAIVELQNGKIVEVLPSELQFVDEVSND